VTDRRRQQRCSFLAPADARTHITIDAVVEVWEHDHASVISTSAAAVGDEFVMHVGSPVGELTTWAATVLRCEPLFDHAFPRHRLRVAVTPTDRTWEPASR